MGWVLSRLAGFILAGLATLFGSWKTFLGGVLIKLILAVVLYNLVVELAQELLTWVLGKMATGGVSGPGVFDMGTVSAMGAYLCNKLRVAECLSYIVAMILLKWTLRKIPFVKW